MCVCVCVCVRDFFARIYSHFVVVTSENLNRKLLIYCCILPTRFISFGLYFICYFCSTI